jgi:hypothetical protein
MSFNKNVLARRLERLNALAPLPFGYRYQVESNGGYGGPRYYNLAVVRDDFQGGDFIDLPSMGGFTANNMVRYLEGLIEGLTWKLRIEAGLPVVTPAGCAQFEGTEGQDRASYTDDQDRNDYLLDEGGTRYV